MYMLNAVDRRLREIEGWRAEIERRAGAEATRKEAWRAAGGS
jgi:hypothetical protein